MNCTNRDIDHLVRVLQLRKLHSFQLCQPQAPVVVQQWAASTLSKNCTCGNSPVFSTVSTVRERLCVATGMSHTRKMNWIWGTSTFSYTMDCGSLSLTITGTSTTERKPPAPALKKIRLLAPPLKSSGNDGGYSQPHRTQAPPQTDVNLTSQYRSVQGGVRGGVGHSPEGGDSGRSSP